MYKSCNFILYADHDISPIDNIISSRVILGTKISTNCSNEVAMVGFIQTPDNRNNSRIFTYSLNLMNLKYFYSINNSDVASGCFITLPKYLDIFAKLQSNYVYGDEDFLIGNLFHENNLISVISNQKVHHPYDNDIDYSKWKKTIAIQILTNNQPKQKLDYWSEK